MPLSRPARPLAALPPLALAVTLALAGCSGSSSPSTAGSSPTPAGQVTVAASDSSCQLSVGTAPAGVLTFEVTNTGSKVTGFYVYAAGDRILGEARPNTARGPSAGCRRVRYSVATTTPSLSTTAPRTTMPTHVT